MHQAPLRRSRRGTETQHEAPSGRRAQTRQAQQEAPAPKMEGDQRNEQDGGDDDGVRTCDGSWKGAAR